MAAARSERAIVYGMEAGAAVSLLFAASFPDRVTGLVLQAPLVHSWKSADFPWGMTPELAREWAQMIERSWGTEEFWRWNFADMHDETQDDDALRAWGLWSRLCASPRAALAINEVEQRVDVRALLPEVRVPRL